MSTRNSVLTYIRTISLVCYDTKLFCKSLVVYRKINIEIRSVRCFVLLLRRHRNDNHCVSFDPSATCTIRGL